MTVNTQKLVYVESGPTGPTGTWEGVNILGTFTGPTGTFPVWGKYTGPTGASGPNGNFKHVYNIGPTAAAAAKGRIKTVIIPGFTGGGGGGGASAFNPADKTANLILSNNNLTATGGDGNSAGARGLVGHSTGKVQLQFVATLLGGLDYVGVGGLGATLATASGSQNEMIIITAGNIFSGNGTTGGAIGGIAGPTFPATYDMCIDFTTNLFWIRANNGQWNGSPTADPVAEVGGLTNIAIGTLFPFIMITGTGANVTLNTAPSPLQAGYSAWN